ncbi:vitamin K epoxide reductase [Actinopolyspora erythraea]|uniref:Vitamin K epoxide reductase n=1 Tax=Actinopolyspora erythraea TaxID=414996 RepID=A0A099D6F0_9ACTN|nr:vitamin K epoxide reductase family protein [Actinopolyspora erythraea]ASU78284.1 vitamin K epoxide reductase [Actinopolyspora erythraea]KGI81748.1 vitamin K epoxide reductase [Actinopolyspora erythraea]
MTATAETNTRDDSSAPAHSEQAPFGRALGWLYLIGGGIGFLAAFALSIEEYLTLINPDYVTTCSINPVVSCGSVMESDQAKAFGFPNPLIGIAAFAIVTTSGVAMLSGFRPPRWYRIGMQLGTIFGVVFVHWLIWQSLYEIHALCPYCMVVWVVTIAIFWYTTLHNLGSGHIPTGPAKPLVTGVSMVHSVVLVLWYLVIVGMILQAFWTYWSGLL